MVERPVPNESHLSPDELEQAARSVPPAAADADPLPARVADHLEHCAGCRAEVDTQRRVIAALVHPTPLEEPPAGAWERLAVQLNAERGSEDPDDGAPVERRRRVLVMAAAAAAGLVVGAGGVALFGALAGTDDDADPGAPPTATSPAPESPAPVAVGNAALEPASPAGVVGEAQMLEDADGQLQLTVNLSSAPDEGYREVWLRDEDGTQLLSLGTMTSTETRVNVPEGVDLAEFPVVDVSQEAFDGDPTHSGLTLAAGPMTTEE